MDKRNRKGGGPNLSILPEPKEKQLAEMIKDKRERGLRVTTDFVKKELQHMQQKEDVTHSLSDIRGYLQRFKRKYRFNSQRIPTRMSSTNPQIIAQASQDFIDIVNEIRTQNCINIDNIFCEDEVAISPGYQRKHPRTWEQIGKSKVLVKEVKHPKINYSCLLLTNASGTIRIAAIVNGNANNSSDDIEIINGVMVINRQGAGSGWVNSDVWRQYIKEIIWMCDEPHILQFDQAPGHMDIEAFHYIKDAGFHPVITPGGTSEYVQPNDRLINREFKRKLDLLMDKHVIQKLQEGYDPIPNPTLPELCAMINESFASIPNAVILQSFKQTGVLTGQFDDFHDDLKEIIMECNVKPYDNSDIYKHTAENKILQVQSRGKKSKVNSNLRYICSKCGKQYAYKHSKSAKNHDSSCNIRTNQHKQQNLHVREEEQGEEEGSEDQDEVTNGVRIPTKTEVMEKYMIAPTCVIDNVENKSKSAKFDDKIHIIASKYDEKNKLTNKDQALMDLKRNVTTMNRKSKSEKIAMLCVKSNTEKYICNTSNDPSMVASNEDYGIIKVIDGKRFTTYCGSKNVAPLPNVNNVQIKTTKIRNCRIIDYLGHHKAYTISNWLKSCGFNIKSDIEPGRQVGPSCGYIAAKAIEILNINEDNFMDCSIANHLEGNAMKNYIKESNVLLGYEDIFEPKWLVSEDIITLLQQSTRKENLPIKYWDTCLDMSPLSIDIFIPKIVNLLENDVKCNQQHRLKSFIFNTDCSNQSGNHWIAIVFEMY